jgi:hypothetical protein
LACGAGWLAAVAEHGLNHLRRPGAGR